MISREFVSSPVPCRRVGTLDAPSRSYFSPVTCGPMLRTMPQVRHACAAHDGGEIGDAHRVNQIQKQPEEPLTEIAGTPMTTSCKTRKSWMRHAASDVRWMPSPASATHWPPVTLCRRYW